MRRKTIAAAALVIGITAGWILLLPSRPAAQPIPFNHARHQALTCVGCHRGVETSASATLPGPDVCAKCHASAPRNVQPAQWTSLQHAEATWIKVTRVPDHVMFSHQRHVTLARLDCPTCHGDIGQLTTPPPRAPIRLEMNTCRACHQQEGASEDCAACHR
jgi:cytochrome c7-like protein/class III cytochrome C family protein